jgi:hypothetical protein
MTHVSYRKAIEWIAGNEDTTDVEGEDPDGWIASINMSMVADLWDKPIEKVIADIRRLLGKGAPPRHVRKGTDG